VAGELKVTVLPTVPLLIQRGSTVVDNDGEVVTGGEPPAGGLQAKIDRPGDTGRRAAQRDRLPGSRANRMPRALDVVQVGEQ